MPNWPYNWPYKGNPDLNLVELNKGAHYYAYSPVLSTSVYTEAFANIVLPTAFQNIPIGVSAQYASRNGYICLGLRGQRPSGDSSGVDIGLLNTGNGWRPFYYDVASGEDEATDYSEDFSDYIASSSATNAIIVVKPMGATSVGLYVRFVNSAGTTLLTFDQTLPVNYRASWSQYYRFASLIPSLSTASSINTDSTYMLGGQFTNLGLYNQSTGVYYPWGLYSTSPELISDYWTVYHPRCNVTYTNNSDSFTIDHWA